MIHTGKNTQFHMGQIKLDVCSNSEEAGKAAAHAFVDAVSQLRRDGQTIGVVFATGASQLPMLRALVSAPGVPWEQIEGLHLDEYVGLPVDHPASFRRYLRENLTQRVPLKAFHEIDGNAADLAQTCKEYAGRLRAIAPQICLLGIGENGHLAFNDPGEADFDDPVDVKVVHLDAVCRGQQLAEGWFQSLQEVPQRAITLTIPAVMRVPKLIVSVPGPRKAKVLRTMLTGPISEACPASVLRRHPDVTIYLDPESADELEMSRPLSGR